MLVKKSDVLSSELISSVRAFSDAQETIRTNHRNWVADVVGLSGPIYLIDLPEELTLHTSAQLSKAFTEFDFSGLRPKVTHTFGGRFSFIPWHTDAGYQLSFTIYLNEVWDRDWGGYFVYEQDGDLNAVVPKFNTAVGFECPVQHCTTMPSINAPLRESIQVFFEKTHEN